jgi:ferredoxin-NADP reductase
MTMLRVRAVSLAGGIGITPLLAIDRHAARERLPHNRILTQSDGSL